MRCIAAILLLAAGASAATVTQTITLSDNQACFITCGVLAFEIQQVSGPVTSASFDFSDSQLVTWGYNNMYQTLGGTFSVDTTTAAYQPDSGLVFSSTVNHVLPDTSYRQIGLGCCQYSTTLSGGGTLDPSMFEGTGTVELLFDLSGHGGFGTQGATSGVTRVADTAALTVTLDPPNAVPEPAYLGAILAGVVLIVAARRRRSRPFR